MRVRIGLIVGLNDDGEDGYDGLNTAGSRKKTRSRLTLELGKFELDGPHKGEGVTLLLDELVSVSGGLIVLEVVKECGNLCSEGLLLGGLVEGAVVGWRGGFGVGSTGQGSC